jgi:cytochrome c556
VKWMRTAGTAQDYDGLYRSVREFRKPTEAELAKLPSNFPESAEVSAMVDTMVEIEQRWDRLKQLAGELNTASSAASEAVLLWEQFREAQRLPDTARLGKEFQAQMNHAEEAANRLRDTLKARPLAHGDLLKSIADVAQSCKTCHQSYRDAEDSR